MYNLVKLLEGILPILINISISYHLVNLFYKSINKLLTIVLSLLVYISVDLLLNVDFIINYTFPKSIIMAIMVPLFVSFTISKLMLVFNTYEEDLKSRLSNNIASTISYILPFIIIFIVSCMFFYIIGRLVNIDSGIEIFLEGDESWLLFLRTFVSNILWFFGIHGINFFDAIVNIKILDSYIETHLTYKEFFNLFVIFGGSGSGLSLIIAIFLASKDKHISFVGKASLPFVIFNINEILIFGIPIFMNFSLLIPFILVPSINFVFSLIFISYTDIVFFNDIFVPWITPSFLNVYLRTDGNFIAVIFQLFLVITGVLIYILFVKRYSKKQSSTIALESIANKLDVSVSLESKANIVFQEAQSSLIKSHIKINKIIDTINQDNLLIYYQPKVDIKNKICMRFEALIRVKKEDGFISGPDFIIDIENSGLASIIDIWVCKEVKKDMDIWKQNNFNPNISINLFPYTLADESYILEIINILKTYDVTFEIIERRSALNEKVLKNINLLKQNGFKLSLDDLGVGYTNFSILYELPFDNVKIDKKILEFTNTKKGLVLYKNICTLCSDLGFEIILEGVETKEELELLTNDNIHIVQGWYFSKALPFDEVESFTKELIIR
ncbi:EAL domain-containing protein [Arcobacter sp. s6]|uniref:EAL domain-containing protein n=1 Tax=Arcobacter sp. s6 TaxID=3230363 RepID=UPI0034A0A97F